MKAVLSVFLCLVLFFGSAGCSVAQFTTVLNEIGPAIGVILQIVALAKGVPVGSGLQSKIAADAASVNKLIVDFDAAGTADKGSIEAEINGAFTVLQSDLGQVFVLCQVSNANTQAKLTSLIGLVQGLVQIAEAAIPTGAASVASKATPVSANQFVSTWNKTLTAKTGDSKVDAFTAKHQYHRHSMAARILSLGLAQ